MTAEASTTFELDEQDDPLEAHEHDLTLVESWFGSFEGFEDATVRRDILSKWSGSDFIDFIQSSAAVVRGAENGHQMFDGDNVTLGTTYLPDHRDKELLLMKAWDVVGSFLSNPDLDDTDALNYSGLVAGASIVLTHPFSDGNGRVSRLIECLITRGNSDDSETRPNIEELKIIMSENGRLRWPTAPFAEVVSPVTRHRLFEENGGWDEYTNDLKPEFAIDLNIGEIAASGLGEKRASFNKVSVKESLLQFVESDAEPRIALYHFYKNGDQALRDMFLRHVKKASPDEEKGTLDANTFFDELEASDQAISYCRDLSEFIRLVRQTPLVEYLDIVTVNKPTSLWIGDAFIGNGPGLKYLEARKTSEGLVSPLDLAVARFMSCQGAFDQSHK